MKFDKSFQNVYMEEQRGKNGQTLLGIKNQAGAKEGRLTQPDIKIQNTIIVILYGRHCVISTVIDNRTESPKAEPHLNGHMTKLTLQVIGKGVWNAGKYTGTTGYFYGQK